jgi:hypothetical protein
VYGAGATHVVGELTRRDRGGTAQLAAGDQSDSGGMTGKVRGTIDGFHFPAANAIASASLLLRLPGDRVLLIDVSASMSGHPAPEASIEDRIEVDRQVVVAASGTQ